LAAAQYTAASVPLLADIEKSLTIAPHATKAVPKMFLKPRLILNLMLALVLASLCSELAPAQQKPGFSPTSRGLEFPVVLRQNLVSGKTAVGTKIQAKLAVATLVEGTVIPRNAVFSGEVIESVAKTADKAARLAIRMDVVKWKDLSAPAKVYLTSWFYPTTEAGGQNLQYGPTQPASRTWNGAGAYPDPNSKIYKPFPEGASDKTESVPDTPSSTLSNRRVLMRDVQSEKNREGVITLVSYRVDIKLDRITTYVLAAGDLQPPPTR
jgi:hypothetical protein